MAKAGFAHGQLAGRSGAARIEVIFETAKFNNLLRNVVLPSAPASAGDVIRMTALELMKRVMRAWPVLSGRSRAAWFPIFDHLGKASPPSKGNDPAAIAEGRRLGSYKETKTAHGLTAEMVNRVKYAPALEAGWSKKAPTGAVRNSMRAMMVDVQKGDVTSAFIRKLKGVRLGA